MPQFFPDGPSAINLNSITEQGGITLPDESSGTFDTPGLQGSMQQLLSENLGKFVLADFLVGVSSIVRRVGILYSVGRGFLVLYQEEYHVFQVCDIFSLKFVSFFPPGFEPSIDQLLRGDFASGILMPGTGGILTPNTSGGGMVNTVPSGLNTGGSPSMSHQNMNSMRGNSSSRTLGQR